MSQFVEQFKSNIDAESARSDFPEITDSETPIWRGGPATSSMADKYILSIMVLLVHIAFFLGELLDTPEGEGQANFVLSLVIWLIDTTGVMGFVICMLILTKINHYANFSTSGKWTTSWLLICCIIPLLWKLMDVVEWIGGFFDSGFSSPLPSWNYSWFAPLGLLSFVVMVSLTVLYQRSFHYAITDKRIHIRQRFLYFETSAHGISYHKVENLKAYPTILGRILGFGNIHVVTGSEVGLQVESLGAPAGVEPEIIQTPGGKKRIFSFLLGWITLQRDRTVEASDPADCLYGVRRPMDVYRLINELMDANVGPAVE
ncbi:MAG: PH domain-containing protein [Candidatus Thermoplasmatota archaeon]|nr:PH domain-containing protein [Candidatus Thermoplasmatota archaeon]